MCDRLTRTGSHCPRPADWVLLVEMTGEELELCDACTNLYNNGHPISYTPRPPTKQPKR